MGFKSSLKCSIIFILRCADSVSSFRRCEMRTIVQVSSFKSPVPNNQTRCAIVQVSSFKSRLFFTQPETTTGQLDGWTTTRQLTGYVTHFSPSCCFLLCVHSPPLLSSWTAGQRWKYAATKFSPCCCCFFLVCVVRVHSPPLLSSWTAGQLDNSSTTDWTCNN